MAEPEGVSKIQEPVVVSMYPDVCLKSGVPVPYDLHALARDDTRASPDVNYLGARTLKEGTRLSTCYGNEPADAGVQSGCVKGMCRPVDKMADTVLVNGEKAVRHDTEFDMNHPGPDGPTNTKGAMVHQRGPAEPAEDDEAEKKRKETLKALEEHQGKPDFYDQLAKYDPAHADWWKQMSGVQNQFAAAEPGYDAATRAYSESMRETLHQSTINLFNDPAALQQVNANGSSGLYDWYIGMHRTAFDQNGAWNGDFLGRGTQVMWNTPGAMYGNAGRLLWGDSDEPHAKLAAEQVRERRKKEGLRVTRKPGEKLPETLEQERIEEQFRKEHPYLWSLSKMGSVPGL